MGKSYQNKLFRFVSMLKDDLQDKRINEEQFKFLLGMFISNEFSSYVNNEIKDMWPDSDDDQNITFVSYKRSRGEFLNYSLH